MHKSRGIPITSGGDVPVLLQDQTTPPLITYFLKSLTSFTLASDTGESGVDVGTFVYTFEANAGHGISADDQIILLDVDADRQFFAIVISVSTNTITLDRPIDHNFQASNSLGRRVTNDLKVDGSVTPEVFTVRAGQVAADALSLNLTIICTSEPTDELFGNITSLDRGVVFRIVDSYNRTLGSLKDNGTLRRFGATVDYIDKAGGTNWAVNINLDFSIKWGIAFRIQDDDVLQVVVQDDLDTPLGIVAVYASLVGHYTEGEN